MDRRYINHGLYPAPAKMAVNAMVWNMDGMPGIFLTEYGKLAHAFSSNISQLVCLFRFSFISLWMQGAYLMLKVTISDKAIEQVCQPTSLGSFLLA